MAAARNDVRDILCGLCTALTQRTALTPHGFDPETPAPQLGLFTSLSPEYTKFLSVDVRLHSRRSAAALH